MQPDKHQPDENQLDENQAEARPSGKGTGKKMCPTCAKQYGNCDHVSVSSFPLSNFPSSQAPESVGVDASHSADGGGSDARGTDVLTLHTSGGDGRGGAVAYGTDFGQDDYDSEDDPLPMDDDEQPVVPNSLAALPGVSAGGAGSDGGPGGANSVGGAGSAVEGERSGEGLVGLPLNPSVSEPGSMALTSSRGPKASPAHERVLLSTRKFKRGPKPKGGTVKDLIDLAEIKAKFHLPRHMAAHELGISDTCLKKCVSSC